MAGTEAFSPGKNRFVTHHTAIIHIGQRFARQLLFPFRSPSAFNHQSPSFRLLYQKRQSFPLLTTCHLNNSAISAIGRNSFIGWSGNDKKLSR